MNLSDLIVRNAAFVGDKPAIRFEGRVLSYAGLARRIDAAARGLASRLGVGRGDRVAILASNHPDTLVLLYACARLGAMLVPLNWRLAPAEQLFILRDATVKVLVVEDAFAAVVEPLRAAMPDVAVVAGLGHVGWVEAIAKAQHNPRVLGLGSRRDPTYGSTASGDLSDPLLIVYTSGTTGRPKGAVLRQEALVWNAAMSQHMHDMTSSDHILTVLPLFHVGGLNIQTTPALQLGATVTLHARFAPEATLAAIAHDKPTLTVLVPATMQAVIEHQRWAGSDISSLRALTTGSTQVPQALVDPFVARGVPVLQVYGSTETSPIAVYTRLGGDWRRPGSTGLPGLHCEAMVVDASLLEVPHGIAGEVVVRGPNVFTEYWGNPAATTEALRDGWYYSGDIGSCDADGHFFIHDRKKNMIISGGENIYPAEVERVLLGHPGVAEAAVIGRADPKWQEVPVACVVRRPGASVTAEEIERFCLAELARYKVPRDFVFLDALPRNVMGKVQHFMLEQQLGSRQDGTP